MKTKIILQALFLLFTFVTFKANSGFNEDPHDKEYFKIFRKNEEPKNKSFKLLKDFTNKKGNDFYVIYKENSEGQGYYFKIVLDEAEKPVATYYANDDKENAVGISTVQSLIKLLPDFEVTSPEQCVTDCHRKNKCYDKPTNTGVLMCSLDCQLSCSSN